MHNVHVNQLRSKSGAAVALDDESVPPTASPAQADALELRDLQTMLLRLPEEQRQVVLMVGLEQMTYEETAGVLGIPIGTVMSRLSRGRERLRALLTGVNAANALKVVK